MVYTKPPRYLKNLIIIEKPQNLTHGWNGVHNHTSAFRNPSGRRPHRGPRESSAPLLKSSWKHDLQENQDLHLKIRRAEFEKMNAAGDVEVSHTVCRTI
jgi:hypothetical protein